MKTTAKLILVAFGFTLALVSTSSNSKANTAAPYTGKCINTGDCGTTAGGVKLIGYWREDAL